MGERLTLGCGHAVCVASRQELHIGLMTLKKQPGYRSIRNWLMALLAYQVCLFVT
jgi:hypothetical protein